ncbi:MAG: 3'(2'),5'-bisphosphate nucleotidase CysQ [Candidatus Binatus sp.]|uniref:3'(2'),5'-bisphosphate nucleotidase CysQ n=1 Tax=Candidatus Binatus sp. TaxID=2811406 RepID=UPI002720DAB1|nr:3'(2'),5'-bisphosphate nucleotidase CysQ [Candidatus Binatus sp.]MDO8432636.1 3'(2'),5'-bisphosphate nucleotidase CysQ [Candidatus Binatus sp.]
MQADSKIKNAAPSAKSGGARAAADDDLKRELALAKKAARAAGEILRGHWRRGGYEIGSKGHDNPVTQADLEADHAIKSLLREPFPDYGWLSEETVDNDARLKCRRVWIVDPLDGTKEFIRGVPEFCVAIALIEDGVPILGVTYNPIKREMYSAARGAGCYLNSKRVHVTRTRTLKRATVLASRSETARGEWQVFHGVMKVSPTGSVAYKLALVAGGKGDATFTRSPKSEWDIASGAALVMEAGGSITDIRGRELRFNQRVVKLEGLIADNKLLHRALMEVAPHPALKSK